eukprot:763105-Hanusia_phi.AAC.1
MGVTGLQEIDEVVEKKEMKRRSDRGGGSEEDMRREGTVEEEEEEEKLRRRGGAFAERSQGRHIQGNEEEGTLYSSSNHDDSM